ncbi:MAG: tetratricopeptide repeat protein, partial [Planctomycetes bacterium]|nr:tetratricopeptide repeat protein [Planctomycetota bacterium]
MLLNRASVLLDLARWEEACADLLKVLKDHPDRVEGHALLARAYTALGRRELAREQWLLFLAARPGAGEALWRLGCVQAELGEVLSGLMIMERAMERLPRRSPGRFLELAEAWADAGQTARGLQWIDRGTRELGSLASLRAGAERLGRSSQSPPSVHRVASGLPWTAQSAPVPPNQGVFQPRPQSIDWIPLGATWRYLDDGSDPGPLWTSPGFNDSGWGVGPAQLGYGDGDEQTVVGYGPDPSNKYRTTYFRREFQALAPSLYGTLRLRLMRDDGAVVYLNGAELVRDNMPSGAIDSQTFASQAVGGAAESQLYEFVLDPDLLLTGSNLLAVEIHQATPSSSDISFDAALVGEIPVTVV